MERSLQILRRGFFALLTLLCVMQAGRAFAGLADDTSFFTASVPPNVVFLADTSRSMNDVIWHPLYDPEASKTSSECPYVPYDQWEFDKDGNPIRKYWKCLQYDLCNLYTNNTQTAARGATTTINPRTVGGSQSAVGDNGAWGTVSYSSASSSSPRTKCFNGNITYFHDADVRALGGSTAANYSTRWSTHYANWYFSMNASLFDVARDPVTGKILRDANGKAYASTVRIRDNIAATANGTRSQCLVDEGWSATYSLYRRARIVALKAILRDVICRTNQEAAVRFGLARFAEDDDQGGYISAGVADYTTTHGAAIDTAIDNRIKGNAGTPINESLYNVYRYFMSRTSTDTALGKDGTTRFPAYNLSLTGGPVSASSAPPSPVQYTCQRNFVVVLTDGEPTVDDFGGGTSDISKLGNIDLDTFHNKLIGDYNPDNVSPEGLGTAHSTYGAERWSACPAGYSSSCSGVTWYLDDIAKFMAENDARPDLGGSGTGVQNVETYTVGFATTVWANSLLEKTANVGNGKFFYSNNAEELADALSKALADILNKTQFFTAATVPATRTTANNNFYASFFKPRKDTPFWEGHVVNYSLYLDGSILDRNNDCALLDTAGNPIQIEKCATTDGNLPTENWSNAWWDAGAELKKKSPDPAASVAEEQRTLYYAPAAGLSSGSTPALFAEGTVTRADLGLTSLTSADVLTFQNAGSVIASTATSDTTEQDKLVAELVWHLRGCTFETARFKATCTKRENMLGDIFHGNPLLVGPPSSPVTDVSFKEFKEDHKDRYDRLLVASNDGFLHAFDAGPSNDGTMEIDNAAGHGTGEELWGFMPYDVRTRVKTVPEIQLQKTSARSGVSDTGLAEYFVDGSPQAADVWIYSTPGDTSKSKTEWLTLLMGGLRQGGRSYYALDITNDTPKYLWEFPAEGATSSMPGAQVGHMGESWSEPVITRIRVKYGSTNGGMGPDAKGYERWVAIFGAGYSVKSDPDNVAYSASSNEGRAIFVVDIKTGQVLAQKYFKASPTAAEVANGAVPDLKYAIAARPTVFDLNFDGYADVIYIGDLGGNVWKWIMSPDCTTALANCRGDDTVNQVGKDLGQPNWKFELFFQAPAYSIDSSLATMGDNSYRSIYEPLTGAYVNRKLHLVVGTGNRASVGELDVSTTTADNQRVYVFVDDAPLAQDYVRTSPATATSVPAVFGHHTVTGQPAPYDSYSVRMGGPVWLVEPWSVLEETLSPNICGGSLASAYAGYYVEGENHERFITNPVISLGRVLIGSYVPDTGSLADPCLGGGSAYLWAFDVDCGKSDLEGSDGTLEEKQRVGGGLGSDIVVSTGPDTKPDCTGLSGNLKKLCDGFNENCQVKEYMVSGSGGLHNNCRDGKLDNKPRFKAWRVEQ